MDNWHWLKVHVGGPVVLLMLLLVFMYLPWAQAWGWVAAVLTVCTFYSTRMLLLRLMALSANVSFIEYGYLEHLMPVLALHAVLLPLNVIRIVQLKSDVKAWRKRKR